MNDAHADLEVYCHGERDEKLCGTTVTYADDYTGMVSKRGYSGQILRLRCPECGEPHDVCPVCHGSGWFEGESTGKQLACHVCNQREATMQEQDPWF